MGRAHPAHVAFDENLHCLAANAAAALQRLPHTAFGGHMSSDFHGALEISLNIQPGYGRMNLSQRKRPRETLSRAFVIARVSKLNYPKRQRTAALQNLAEARFLPYSR